MSKALLPAVLLMVLASCWSGCSFRNHPATPGAPQLPENWITHPAPSGESVVQDPEPEMESGIQDALEVHGEALDSLLATEVRSVRNIRPLLPADWTPWHLEGFMGSFGVTADGYFGALMTEGTASLKAIWRPILTAPHEPKKKSEASPRLPADIRLGPADAPPASVQLEPAIRAALATGKIKDEAAFRSNASAFGRDFQEACQRLTVLAPGSGFWLRNFHLDLNFDASGRITPKLSAGATVNLRFDWERGRVDSALRLPPVSRLSTRTRRILDFASQITSELTDSFKEAASASKKLHETDFRLDEVRFSLGFSANGTLGIVKSQVFAMGTMTFERLPSQGAEDPTLLDLASVSPKPESIPLLTAAESREMNVTPINRRGFRRGLARSMRIAAHFARIASRARSSKWLISEFESEFDLTVGGSMAVATINSEGSVVLNFANTKFERE